MKILLLQSTPAHGGAAKANLALLAALAARGHRCTVFTPAATIDAEITREELLERLHRQGLAPQPQGAGLVTHTQDGVEVVSWLSGFERAAVTARVHEIAPDWLLLSEDDPMLSLLEWVPGIAPERSIFVAHTPLILPFGDDSFLPRPGKAALLQRMAGALAPSVYVRDLIRRHAGVPAEAVRFPVYGPEPFPAFGSFAEGFVTLVNPCAYKGISIFLELARRCPDLPFAAVPTWGTTRADRESMEALPNVRLLAPSARIDEIFARTRILLAPSLWGEAFGQIVPEAMLRGIPVLASDAGGLPEAKLGVDQVLPVRKIERYERRFDERMMPVPVVPPQDVAPWAEALRELTTDRERYERLSAASREAALSFVRGIDAAATVEGFLARLAPRTDRLSHLAPDKRARLSDWLGRARKGS
ncbi:MAG TPA: glycosyltransferase family 4 protein [Thermoanaerobaculia bacterium]|nr:glycosyltransferase family 4 protein [Thermoanaerobaculia bacterium]